MLEEIVAAASDTSRREPPELPGTLYLASANEHPLLRSVCAQLAAFDDERVRAHRVQEEAKWDPRSQHALSRARAHWIEVRGKVLLRDALAEERRCALRAAAPAIMAALQSDDQRVCAALQMSAALVDDRLLRSLVDSMPSVALSCDFHACRTLGQRPYHSTDFWDVEHAAVPGSYADVFASSDRGLVDILRSSETVRSRGVVILRGLDELAAWTAEQQRNPKNRQGETPDAALSALMGSQL